jgi:uroporphyrinogen-III decarboxylase
VARIDQTEKKLKIYQDGNDTIIKKNYILPSGELNETLRYILTESTLVQKQQLISNYKDQSKVFEEFVFNRSWRFDKKKFDDIQNQVGDREVVIAGELFSPLKMLHLCLGLIDTTYFLIDYEDLAFELLFHHEKEQLDLLQQLLEAGAEVIMAMDKLDAGFHPPYYVEKYSASFYEKASSLCHSSKSKFFIHACGQQKSNLKLISSLGVDGLAGVAYSPLCDAELDEAFKMTHDTFIITGGAHERESLTTRQQVFEYVKTLFEHIKPYSNRFIFSASCNTPINTSWETIKHFRDAWLENRNLL